MMNTILSVVIVIPVVTEDAATPPTRPPPKIGRLCIIPTIVTVLIDEKRISPPRNTTATATATATMHCRIRATSTAALRCPA